MTQLPLPIREFVGHVDGVRDYYLPSDAPFRRTLEVMRKRIADGRLKFESPVFCELCGNVDEMDAFDALGGDGKLYCPRCQGWCEGEAL